jgi:hypothetical protein
MTPKEQLDGFLGAFEPGVERAARSALATVRRLVPCAVEMVYDNAYALVIGFGPTERPSEAVLSVAVFPDHVTLCFLWGAELEDPGKRLQGDGRQVRNVRLETPAVIDEPAVRRLIAAAVAAAEPPFEEGAKRKIVIRAVSANRRARRPGQNGAKKRKSR